MSNSPETSRELAERVASSYFLGSRPEPGNVILHSMVFFVDAVASLIDRYVKVKEAEAYLNLLMRIKSEIPLDPVYFWQHEIRNAQEFLAQARAELEKMK